MCIRDRCKSYVLNGAYEDELVKEVFTKIKEENGKLDGIVHAIAHANTEDLHHDFIFTSKEGFSHANDVSAYSFVLTARMAKELDMLNENASLVTLTYHGSTKVLEGYNVMGVAKAALEASVRYLSLIHIYKSENGEKRRKSSRCTNTNRTNSSKNSRRK